MTNITYKVILSNTQQRCNVPILRLACILYQILLTLSKTVVVKLFVLSYKPI